MTLGTTYLSLNFLPLMILFLIPIISFVLFSFFYLSFTSSSKPYGEVRSGECGRRGLAGSC